MAKSQSERGQAVVELALALPVICVFALFIAQIGLVVRDQVTVIHATGSAARAASISADPVRTAEDAIHSIRYLKDAKVNVEVRDGYVTVTISRLSRTDLPLIGLLTPDIGIGASASYRMQE